jgi:hypothetical protein
MVGKDGDFIVGSDIGNFDFRKDLKKLTMPVLIYGGRFDRVAVPKMMVKYRDYCPQAKFIMFEKGRLFTCSSLEELGYKFDHCISCHSEFEEGDGWMCERNDGDDTLLLCCSAAIWFDCQDEMEIWKRLREKED